MEKDNFISTAKAIGIILMVLGHAISQNFAYRFIYMFHMPLFFFCSGYFFKIPDSWNGVGYFVLKRVKGLYWPFVKWGIVFLLFHNIFCTWHIYSTEILYYDRSEFLHRLRSLIFTMTGQDQLLDPFWFLKQLFLASLLVCVIVYMLRKVKFRYKDALTWLFLFFMAVISKHYEWGLPVIWDLSIIFLSASFVYAGYMYRKMEKETFYSVRNLTISFFVILLVVWIWDDYLDMLWYNDHDVFLYVPMALLGVYMTLTASKLIERCPMKRLFYYLGKNTMIIFVFHLLVFKIGNYMKIVIFNLPYERLSDYKIIYDYNYYFWFVYLILGCTVPLLLNYLFKNTGRKFLGNKRDNKFPA